MEKEEKIDMLSEYESKNAYFEDITTMLWYLIEDYYTMQKNDIYTKANNYDRLYCYLSNIHMLLLNNCKEMEEVIKKAYQTKNNQ